MSSYTFSTEASVLPLGITVWEPLSWSTEFEPFMKMLKRENLNLKQAPSQNLK